MSKALPMRRGKAFGITLLELLIVLVVVGILTAIAVPSYSAYVVRGQRAAAKAALMRSAQFLERNYTANGCYQFATPAECAAGAGTNISQPAALTVAPEPASGPATYTVGWVFASSQTYSLTATPTGGFVDQVCNALTLDQTGLKGMSGATATDPAACWGH
jgi:type IV pilus assembly protein PilE